MYTSSLYPPYGYGLDNLSCPNTGDSKMFVSFTPCHCTWLRHCSNRSVPGIHTDLLRSTGTPDCGLGYVYNNHRLRLALDLETTSEKKG